MQQALNNAANFDPQPNARQQFYVHASSYEGAPRAVKGVLQTREPIIDAESGTAYALHVLETVARAARISAVNAAVVLTTEPMPINLNNEGGFCVVGNVRVGAEHRVTISIGRGLAAP